MKPRQQKKTEAIRKALSKLDLGDSILVRGDQATTRRASIYRMANLEGITITTRVVKNGLRIWRVSKP